MNGWARTPDAHRVTRAARRAGGIELTLMHRSLTLTVPITDSDAKALLADLTAAINDVPKVPAIFSGALLTREGGQVEVSNR